MTKQLTRSICNVFLICFCICPVRASTLTLSQSGLMALSFGEQLGSLETARMPSGNGVEYRFSVPAGPSAVYEWQNYTESPDLYLYSPYRVSVDNPTVRAETWPHPYRLVGVGFLAYPLVFNNPGSSQGWSQDAEVRLLVEPTPGAIELNSSSDIPMAFPLSSGDTFALQITLVSVTGFSPSSNDFLGVGAIAALQETSSIPEPVSAVLLLTGLVGIVTTGSLRRRLNSR